MGNSLSFRKRQMEFFLWKKVFKSFGREDGFYHPLKFENDLLRVVSSVW